MVQWLRLCALHGRGPSSILVEEQRSHVPQGMVQKKKKRKSLRTSGGVISNRVAARRPLEPLLPPPGS